MGRSCGTGPLIVMSEAVSRGRHRLTVLLALGIGLIGGYWLGGSGDSPPRRGHETAARGAPSEGPAGAESPEVDLSAWMMTLALAAQNQSLEGVIEELKSQQIAPRDFVHGAIEQVGEDEIRRVLSMMTQFSQDDLDDVRNIRAFASRLSDIALEGTLEPQNERGPHETDVFFSDASPRQDPDPVPIERFPSTQGRIYAIFETSEYPQSKVLLKWFRTDEANILLLRRYNVIPGDEYGWVWLDRAGRWRRGTYRVDVYTGDEAMTRLGSGTYVIE